MPLNRYDAFFRRVARLSPPPNNIAMIHNGLDERGEALAWLERGYDQREPMMTFLKVEPKWNNLRDDPRFQDLMRRVGFTP